MTEVPFLRENIERFLARTGIRSQRELAHRASMDYGFLNRMMMGKHSPTYDTLKKLADALGVEPADLIARPKENQE